MIQISSSSTIRVLLALFSFSNVVLATVPSVDFDRMGKVGLAGAFAGLDIFQNSSSTVTFDSSTSTLLSRSSGGSLSPLGSTNQGGQILAGCSLSGVFYLAGSFSSIASTSANNVASYTPSSRNFAALGSNGPNGPVHAVYCDEGDTKVWVGGNFTSPSSAVALWDPKSASWSSPPFTGLSNQVLSITSNSSQSSLFFAGSFITTFQGNSTIILNSTNNPNVPFSQGASPFSSSLVPIPLQGAQVDGSPSSSDSQFGDIKNILCPSGEDGAGNSWFAADDNTAVITIRTFTSMAANGLRLGNTFLSEHGTTGFSVTSIPDNTLQHLTYVDLTTGENLTCTDTCPLSTDSSILYQDFLFDHTLSLTGVQIKLSQWTGTSPGLHILQLLSSGAFASAVDSQNTISCFAPNPSNATFTGHWTEQVANTNIAGTTQSVLVSTVSVGTSAAQGPSFTWIPYVSASGDYDINLLIPGCTNFQDCALRTSVKITVFPGRGLDPWVSTVSQQGSNDATTLIYSGPILPSSPNFVVTVTMALADSPAGNGQGGKYELVADRVQMLLKSVNATSDGRSGNNGTAGTQQTRSAFGFFEWPLSLPTSSTIDATKILPNSTQTALDVIGFGLFSGAGGSASLTSSATAIAAVVHHASGAVFLGGSFTLSSGATNIVMFKDGSLAALPDKGLNGPVTSLVLDGDKLYVGGLFRDTSSMSQQGALGGIAMYDVQQNEWAALQAGVNGHVTSLGFANGQVQVAGNFTKLLTTATADSGLDAAGFATWDVSRGAWVNSGGFLVGDMSFIGNGTVASKGQQQSQFLAGNVAASQTFGASGLVMLQNSNSDQPQITPLGVPLDSAVDSSPAVSTKRRRSHIRRGPAAWIPHLSIAHLFARQSSSHLVPLPASPAAPAPAVLAGAFWTNTSSSREVAIIGGNFSFTPSSSSTESQGVAIYDPQSSTITALAGPQLNGTVRTLLVHGSGLFVGGEFTLSGTNVDGLAIYDLSTQQWDVSGLQTLQANSGLTVVVRSITSSTAKANTIVVAGSFAQAGSLPCQSICSFDTNTKQWNALGDGIQGEVASVSYAGDNKSILIASGSIALSDNTAANVAQFSLSNSSWASVGAGTDLPGPVTAVEANNGNASSIFAAGRSNDGASPFLAFWNGVTWTRLDSTLQAATNVSQLTMVPLQDTHAANGIIEPDRMLLVSGALRDSTFGNASSVLFDGQTFFPYIVTTSSSGTLGTVSSLFHSFASFSFSQHHFLATGVVILISIAIAAGLVFLMALIGILWTLFSRREDKMNKYDAADEDDDDSTQHRPSSLLEHINAATRTTILGATSPFSTEKEEGKVSSPTPDQDPFGADASNYVRAETPSDAVAGMVAGEEEMSRPAHARYSFDGTGEGELALSAGLAVEVLDDRDPAWWYARDTRTGKEGVVPAAYLY